MTDTKQQLRQIFRTMDALCAQEIREAYHKAHEGLMTLAKELELVEADLADSPTPLLDEHMYVVMAFEAMKHRQLGAVL